MAVDFALLPAEAPFDESPPSKLMWGIVFVVMTLFVTLWHEARALREAQPLDLDPT